MFAVDYKLQVEPSLLATFGEGLVAYGTASKAEAN